MSMNVNTEMDSLGTDLATVTGLRVYDFPPDSAYPPFAFVDYPDTIIYDNTKKRGTDSTVFPVFVVVGKLSDRSARDQLSAYLNGSGSSSIKAALDDPGHRRVASATIDIMSLAGTEFLAANFQVEVVA